MEIFLLGVIATAASAGQENLPFQWHPEIKIIIVESEKDHQPTSRRRRRIQKQDMIWGGNSTSNFTGKKHHRISYLSGHELLQMESWPLHGAIVLSHKFIRNLWIWCPGGEGRGWEGMGLGKQQRRIFIFIATKREFPGLFSDWNELARTEDSWVERPVHEISWFNGSWLINEKWLAG